MPPTSIAYVSLSGDDKIAALALDLQTGRLERLWDTRVEGGPAPLALSPDGRTLYAGLRRSCQMAAFRVDPRSGRLSFLNTIDLHSDPCCIAADRTGRFLLSAYYAAGGIAVHPINERGSPVEQPAAMRKTMPKAHCVRTDPSNRFLFLPHVGESNAIFQFLFDPASGQLHDNNPPILRAAEGHGPRHYCYLPKGNIVYFDNEQGSSVTAYRLDPNAGTLTPFQTISTLPRGYRGDNSCAQIWLHPSARSLYVSNRGHDSIAIFAVHPETGELTFLRAQPTLETPRAFGIDPSGAYLLAAGLETGELASYRIDPSSGLLHPLAVQRVGDTPMWVLLHQFRK